MSHYCIVKYDSRINHGAPLSRVAPFNVEVKAMNGNRENYDTEWENPEIDDHRLTGIYTEERYYEELGILEDELYLKNVCGWGK